VAAAVLLLACIMAWGLRSSPGRTGGAANPAEAGRGQARADESLPPATGPGIAAPVVKPVSREPSSAPGLNELKQVGEIRPQAVPGPAGARPTSPTPVHPDRARPAAVDGESLVAAATREGHPDRPGTPRFDLALLKRPVRAKVALEMILAAPGSHSNRVVVPAGMYHLGPPRPDRPGGLWKCSVTEVNEPEFRSRRNDRPKVDSSFSTDLTLEPSLAEHLNKVVQKEQEKLAILSVWVTHSGACVLVKVEILERVICGVKRGYKHQPDIDYETRVVTPEGGKVVKGNDEEWEQVGRLRSLANEYKQRFRAYVEKLRHAGPDDVVVQMPPPSMPEALLPPVPPGMGGGGGPLIVVVPGWLSSSEATTVQGDPAPAPADGPGRVATNRPGSPPPSPGAPANPGGRTPTRIEPPHSANWAPLTRAPLIGRRLGPGYSGQQVQSGSLPGLPSPPGANSGVPAGGHSLDPGHFGQHNQHGSLPGLQPSPGTINGAPATGHSPGPGHDGQHSQAGSLPNHQPSPSSQPGAPTAHAPSHDSNSKK
jgi:hypothetical protein